VQVEIDRDIGEVLVVDEVRAQALRLHEHIGRSRVFAAHRHGARYERWVARGDDVSQGPAEDRVAEMLSRKEGPAEQECAGRTSRRSYESFSSP
jgi:hypothetical protein